MSFPVNISHSRVQQLWHDLFAMQKTTPRLHAALRLSISVAIVFSIGVAFHQVAGAKVGVIGALVAGYGYGMSFSRRLRIQFAVTLFMVVLVLLGSFTHEHRVLRVFFLVISFTIITFLALAFTIGPPGAYLICVDAGMSTILPYQLSYIFWVLFSGAVAMLVTYIYSFFVKLQQQESDFYTTRDILVEYCEAVTEWDTAQAHELRSKVLSALATNTSGLETTKRQLRRNPKRREFFRLNALLQETFIDFFYHELGIKKQPQEDLEYMVQEISMLEPRPHATGLTSKNLTSYRRTFITTRPQWQMRIRTSLRRYSAARRSALRVFVATAITEIIVYHNTDIHTYWAPAAAVIILHSGPATKYDIFSRAFQRTLGCLVGMIIGVLLIKAYFTPVELIGILALLLIIIELTVTRNYALACAFVTPETLLMSTFGSPRISHTSGWTILEQRSLDTALGCFTAVIIALISLSLMKKRYLWSETKDLIISARKLISADIPRLYELESTTPLSITPAFEAHSAELLHMRLQLDFVLPIMPITWFDNGTLYAVQTAKDFTDLALTMHIATNEYTDQGDTLFDYALSLEQQYFSEEKSEKIFEHDIAALEAA